MDGITVLLSFRSPRPSTLHDRPEMREFKGWTDAQIQSIRCPVLLLLGDRDVVTVEHAARMRHLLADARLAVFPATDHAGMARRASLIAPLVEEFLRERR